MQDATRPLPLYCTPVRFPLEAPVVLEACWNGSLDCTRRLKRDQKEAPMSQEIFTYTVLHGSKRDTRTRVPGPPTHTRLFRVPRMRRNR